MQEKRHCVSTFKQCQPQVYNSLKQFQQFQRCEKLSILVSYDW